MNPINLDNGTFQIHPFRQTDLLKHDKVVDDLFEIFSDPEGLPFNQERLVSDKDTIAKWLFGVTVGYHQQTRYTHFITLKEMDKVVGEVLLLAPKVVEDAYQLKDIWLMECFLHKLLWNRGIMSGVIAAIVQEIKEQNIIQIGALVSRTNFPSIRVLEKAAFKRVGKFDDVQDLYQC
jgi:RimJ/RimL family protein N-acetyltransferase